MNQGGTMRRFQFNMHSRKFSLTEQRIIAYLEDDALDPLEMTSSSVANDLKISQSTVIRFVQKLGYSGFRSFMVDFNNKAVLNPDFEHDISIDETDEKTQARMYKQYSDVLAITAQSNTTESIKIAISMIKKARRIVVFGMENSGLIAQYLSYQLLKYDIITHHSYDLHAIMYLIGQMNEEDLVILISESGETWELVEVARAATNRNMSILAITGKGKNSLSALSNHVLNTVVFRTITRFNLLSIRISQLYIVDLLIIHIYKTNPDHFNVHVNSIHQIVSNMYKR